MILLDTNIVSEVMRIEPSPSVISWLNEQNSLHLFLSSVTIAEIAFGFRALPMGKRRRFLESRFQTFLDQGFNGQVVPFDRAAAELYASIMEHRQSIGRPMSILDGQIAAIARNHRFSLATRNTRDFEECGLGLVNPFE